MRLRRLNWLRDSEWRREPMVMSASPATTGASNVWTASGG